MQSHWDKCKIPLICHVTHMMEKGIMKRDYRDFAFTLMEVSYEFITRFRELSRCTLEEEIFSSPFIARQEDYVVPQPELRKTLQTLKKHGKKLFIVTDAHPENIHRPMIVSIG